MREEKRKILVVGGAGYIGSHTAKLLHKQGYEPVVLDDLSTGHRQAVKYGPFQQGDSGDTALVKRVLTEHQIDTVIHFGARALVGESVQDPLLYYAVNVSGTVELLRAMVACKAKHFIFSSTCSTFGEPAEVPIHEQVAQAPVNPYGQSKLFVEKILADAEKAYGIHSAILRYFNAAGADPEGELGEDHDPETHLIPRVLDVAIGRTPKLVINGKDYPTSDGTCVRDYVHVNDLAQAHILAMQKLWQESPGFDVNLGSEHGHSVLEVLEVVQRVTQKSIPQEIGPRRPGDPPVLVADTRKAQRLLGWKPKLDLQAIVETAYRWKQKHPAGYEE